jgi:hypothetical protein
MMPYEIVRRIGVVMVLLIAMGGIFMARGVANAYSLTGGTPGAPAGSLSSPDFSGNWTNTLNNLSAPFQSFMQSLGSINGGSLNANNLLTPPISVPVPSYVSSGVQNIFGQFDAWLYGVAGFHINGVWQVFIGALTFVLVLLQKIISWLLSLLHVQ